MTTWYLIVILVGASQGTAPTQQTIQFQNEDACIRVMETLTEKYDREDNTIICVKDK